jgi:hypothetical protein
LTGPVILGTFRTPEGFAVIKSELIDRISVQNPHLYRQDAEKIVNTIFSEITATMARGTLSGTFRANISDWLVLGHFC